MNKSLEHCRITKGRFASSAKDGFNGFFVVQVNSEQLGVVASDGHGWQHVSVSKVNQPRKVPNYDHMCAIKELFWGPDEWVVQFHPPKSEHVNNHPGCLHLWRPTRDKMPVPDSLLVGWKGKSPEDIAAMGREKVLDAFVKANADDPNERLLPTH